MSDIYAADLMSKLSTVPALSNSAGMQVGGTASDPSMTKIPLPAAWVLLGNDAPVDNETGSVPVMQVLLIEYVVLVYVPYVSEADIINTQIPLLRSARASIHGTSVVPNGNKWKYKGQRLVLVNPDRLAYEQRYAIRVAM